MELESAALMVAAVFVDFPEEQVQFSAQKQACTIVRRVQFLT